MSDLVSIIIPTFNRANLLAETLDSVLQQTHTNWECIIVDDGSTDNIFEIIEKYVSMDSRFRFYKRPSHKTKGANACRNYGFEMSHGTFINWFDSDDIMLPDFIATRLYNLMQNPQLDFCACIAEEFLDDQPEIRIIKFAPFYTIKDYATDLLVKGFFLYTPAPLWRKHFLIDKELFDENLFRGQESDFHFRMLAQKPKFLYLDKVLFGIRSGHPSVSSNAPKSLSSHISIFKYFDKIFNVLKSSGSDNSEILLKYIFYRQAANYYKMNQVSNFETRLSLLFTFHPTLMKYSGKSNLHRRIKGRMLLGGLLLLFFKKGFSFFYYPEYDATR